jgi:lysophospholipase L1-like esterase
MRRTLTIILALALLLVGIGGALWYGGRALAYTPHGKGDLYVAMGDSLAWGARLDDQANQSYPALIHARLAASGPISLANLAVPGETSASILRGQLPRALALISEARAKGQRVSPITLDIGGNDLRNVERAGSDVRAAAVAAVGRNIAQIVDELRRAAGADSDIAVMTYYNPYGGDPAVVGGDAYWVAQLNAAISAAALPRGAAVADAYTPLDGGRAYTHTFILTGDIHANALGHQVLADAFLSALRYP